MQRAMYRSVDVPSGFRNQANNSASAMFPAIGTRSSAKLAAAMVASEHSSGGSIDRANADPKETGASMFTLKKVKIKRKRKEEPKESVLITSNSLYMKMMANDEEPIMMSGPRASGPNAIPEDRRVLWKRVC